jgi:hypothetical protein
LQAKNYLGFVFVFVLLFSFSLFLSLDLETILSKKSDSGSLGFNDSDLERKVVVVAKEFVIKSKELVELEELEALEEFEQLELEELDELEELEELELEEKLVVEGRSQAVVQSNFGASTFC